MISIIIPVHNEALRIQETLYFLIKNSSSEFISEICVVDGESTDQTKYEVRNMMDQYPIIRLISSPKGRAIQMNNGVHHSSGEILYFLHATVSPL